MDTERKPLSWLLAGILLGVLNVIVANVLMSHRLIGASTAYPYFSGLLTGLGDAPYMQKIAKPGSWEMYFLFGALAGAFLASVVSKDFKMRLIPARWQEVKGQSKPKRIFWAFTEDFCFSWERALPADVRVGTSCQAECNWQSAAWSSGQ